MATIKRKVRKTKKRNPSSSEQAYCIYKGSINSYVREVFTREIDVIQRCEELNEEEKGRWADEYESPHWDYYPVPLNPR